MRSNNITPIIIFTLVAIFLYGALQSKGNKTLIGSEISDYSGRYQSLLTKESFAFPQNEVYLLHFSASWCGYCKRNLEHLRELKNRTGIKIIGVAWHDREEDMLNWVKEHAEFYDDLIMADGRLSSDFKISGVPETFIIDEQGIIIENYKGLMSGDIGGIR